MATRLTETQIQELSLVLAEYAGREWAPRNEEARVLGLKGAEKDGFSKFIDAVKSAFGKKAGARHNAADRASLTAMAETHAKIAKNHEKMGKALDAMKTHLDALCNGNGTDEDANSSFGSNDPGSDLAGDGDDKKAAEKGEPKPYGDVKYADPKNGKYPIDTEEHARAAWSYINQEKNAAEYDADELAEVKARIRAACEKFGIQISDDKASEVEMTPDEIKALVAEQIEAVKAEAQAKIDAAKAEAKAEAESAAQAQIDAAKAVADAAKAEAEAAKLKATQAEDEARAAREQQARADAAFAATKSASSTSSTVQKSGLSRLGEIVKAQLAGASLTQF